MRRLLPILNFRLTFSLLIASWCSPVFAQQSPPAAYPADGPQSDSYPAYNAPATTDGQAPVWSEVPPGQSGTAGAPPDVAGPPVARISLVNGDVSVRRGDSNDAIAAVPNAPLMAGDIIATAPGARTELQFDFANRFRLGTEAEARVADLQPGHYRVELAHGTASWSVIGDNRAQVEISTPNIAVRPVGRGLYRLWVRDDGQTVITVRHGSAEVYTQKGTERLEEGQTMFVRGSPRDPEFQVVPASGLDEWDNWNEHRDQVLSNVQSYRYVNPDVYGVEDLDNAGTWVNDPTYGEVWAPQEPEGWAPYQDGNWVWEDYYGWTWLGAEPWGWAPYHYGSWFRGRAGWCWYPGPIYHHAFWRPGLVAFFGFGNVGIGIGFGGWANIGWVPLAPFEHFVPWYGRGVYSAGWRGGFAGRVHLTNVNIYNSYRNARVPGAVAGISASNFAAGRFNGAISRVNVGEIRQAGLVRGAMPITPTANNLRFSNRSVSFMPRPVNTAQFFSHGPVNQAVRTPFAQQQQAVQRSLGQVNSRASGTSAAQVFRSPTSNAAGSVPSRFASAGMAGAGMAAPTERYNSNVPRPAPSSSRRMAVPSGSTSSAWSRFGATSPSRGAAGAGQSLRLSPPIVHERSYGESYGNARGYSPAYNPPAYSPAPRYATPAPNYGGSRYGAPSYSPAPLYATPSSPSYSAPRYSAPSYSGAPRSNSAPHYSAPSGGSSAPHYSSSGGGGAREHAGSGGGSHGGGGHRR